jgi:PAS domain S-box-containing protein
MEPNDDEEDLLRSAALQNANAVFQARQRASEDLRRAKEELELRTRELAYSLEMMRATLESTTDAILVTDAVGHITDCNEKFVQLWGTPHDLMAKHGHQELQEFSAKQLKEPEAFLARISEIYTSWPPETFDLLEFADGRVYERYSNIQRINHRPIGRVWSYRDITGKRRSEQALREQSEWFSVTLGSIGDAVITVNNGCKVTFLNPIAEQYTGWSTSEAVGKPLSEVMKIVNETTRRAAANPIDIALAEGRVVSLANHTILISRNDSEFPIEDSAAPIKNSVGEIIGAVMVFHDVSERREKERAMARLYDGEQQARGAAEQANKAKDDFLAALSHELRTPLTPVLAVLSNLRDEVSMSESLAADLEIVRRNVELEARLIDDLLDLTRISRGKLELHLQHIQPIKLIEDAISICATDLNAKHLSLSRVFATSNETISGDGIRVIQVLWNLLKNSIKFTPEGGSITVRTRIVSGESGKRYQIEVQDSGLGIESDEMERLFKAFEQGGRDITRAYGGLGLGLAISRGIVESHGGEITAVSLGKGQGSTFTLKFPYNGTVQGSAVGDAPPEPVPGSPKMNDRSFRLLLVEDHADTAAVLVRLLRKLGHHVVHAPTVAAALAAATKEFQTGKLDLIISDVGLPDGSGLEMMRQLSADYDVRGIALSGFGMDSDIEQSIAAGFSRHLTKPINVSQLRKTINELMLER